MMVLSGTHRMEVVEGVIICYSANIGNLSVCLCECFARAPWYERSGWKTKRGRAYWTRKYRWTGSQRFSVLLSKALRTTKRQFLLDIPYIPSSYKVKYGQSPSSGSLTSLSLLPNNLMFPFLSVMSPPALCYKGRQINPQKNPGPLSAVDGLASWRL